MTNTDQNMNKSEASEKVLAFNAKIKATWSKLSDDDIKLYNGKRDQFFVKLNEKQNVAKEDAEKVLSELEKAA